MISSSTAAGLAVGAYGEDYIDDTDIHTVDQDYQFTTGGGTTYHQGFRAWGIVKAKADAVISSITYHEDHSGDTWDTADTLSAGQDIRGLITSITLASGAVTCHRL